MAGELDITWKDFKALVEAAGVKDDMIVRILDCGYCLAPDVQINRDDPDYVYFDIW